jgi:hypothetical protein
MLLSEAEDNNRTGVIGEPVRYLAQSETLCTWRCSLTGTWEISILPTRVGRGSKAQAARST